MGSEPNLSVKQSVTIDTVINFDCGSDGHRHVNGTCKQAFRLAFFAEPKAWRIHEFPYGGHQPQRWRRQRCILATCFQKKLHGIENKLHRVSEAQVPWIRQWKTGMTNDLYCTKPFSTMSRNHPFRAKSPCSLDSIKMKDFYSFIIFRALIWPQFECYAGPLVYCLPTMCLIFTSGVLLNKHLYCKILVI